MHNLHLVVTLFLVAIYSDGWPRFDFWHVLLRAIYYQEEPNHAAATLHVFMNYMLILLQEAGRDATWQFVAWLLKT